MVNVVLNARKIDGISIAATTYVVTVSKRATEDSYQENIHSTEGQPAHATLHLLSSTFADEAGSRLPQRQSCPLCRAKTE